MCRAPGPCHQPSPKHCLVRVSLYDQPVAESRRTAILRRIRLPGRALPAKGRRRHGAAHRLRSRHLLPLVGEASHWDIHVSDGAAEKAAWSYEAPFDEVAALKGYIAFTPTAPMWTSSRKADTCGRLVDGQARNR
ncbi:MAG: DUF427 domain-containing protein [Alphaproteobacteria bacterium]|nr:DUF427 domain-containing protein [Alphaproteobacteria bacterium]